MKRIAITSIMLIFLLFSVTQAAANPIQGPEPTDIDGPTLMVQKYISDDQVLVGEKITVFVNITNISDDFALNLTISEPLFNSFIFDTVQEYEKYTYVKMGYGASVSYSYTISTEVEGDFIVEPTRIEYISEEGFRQIAFSGAIPFSVSIEEPQADLSDRWQTILSFSLAFAGIPIIIYYLNRFIKR